MSRVLKQQYNWGVIGPGAIAKNFAKAIQVSEKSCLAAVASRSAERAQAFADLFNIDKVFSDYASMLSDPDIDVIYIATPHSFHYQQAKMCLEAGKHVLLEKPATINAAQLEHLVLLSKEKGVLLQEALWSRFLPCAIQVKSIIQADTIGDIKYINSNIGFAFDKAKVRMFDPKLAGGALLDLGVYSIALSQYFLDENPHEIQAMGEVSALGVDENTLVNMLYASGRFSQFSCSATAQSSNQMHIMGTKGFIILKACFWDTLQAELYIDNVLTETINIPHKVNGFEYQIDESIRCIERGQYSSALMTQQDSLANMQIMDEIRRQIGLQYSAEIEDV